MTQISEHQALTVGLQTQPLKRRLSGRPALHFKSHALLSKAPSSGLKIKKLRFLREQSEKKINRDLNSCLWTHSLAR